MSTGNPPEVRSLQARYREPSPPVIGEASLVAYNASKFGVGGLTMTAAIELAPCNIRVNAVAPEMIRTRFSQAVLDADPELAKAYPKDKIPLTF
jgi:NAD(P)-dependent dehydrogenase (short-subunit alcohol dehydrogenase family)